MDPNAAFESILRGHMMADHVEALHDWIKSGGFLPAPQLRPVDVPECLDSLPFDTDLIANRFGLCVRGQVGNVLFTWRELTRMAADVED